MAGDPWVVQPHEHAKFTEHFRNLGPVKGHLTGEQAKRFMLQSQLPPPILGQIWSLADTNADGKLDLREFSIACKIINLKLHGIEIPKVLPPSLLASLSPAAPQKQFTPPAKPPIPPMPSMPQQQPLISGLPPQPPTTSLLGDFGAPSQPPAIPPLIPPSKPMAPPSVPDLISGVKPISQQPLIDQDLSSQPLIGSSQPLIGSTQPLIGGTQPLIGGQPPLIPPTQPLMSQPLMPGGICGMIPPTQPPPPLIPTSQPSQPLTGSNQSLIGSAQSLIGGAQPLISTAQPLIGSAQPLVGSAQPLVGSAQPLVGSQSIMGGTTVGSLINSPPKPVNTVAGSLPSQPVTSTPITAVKSEVLSKPGSVVTSPTDQPLGMMSPPPMEWGIPQPQKLKYNQLFNATDRAKTGWVGGAAARSIMLQSRLPQQALAQIWALADLDQDGKLGCEEFVLAMYLCEKATQGEPVPAKLPPELIPPTFRRESVTSTGSSKSYEDRRRENLARGQAELERRRSQLADQHMKEKNFEPIAVDLKMHGKFFNADSYIVLKTTGDNNSTYSYDAHFWLGSKTTQDKKGAAAILTVTLDDMLGGRAVHHREVQGYESSKFLGYFQPAIRYLEGGTESGFNQVEINAGAEKRLLKLSGCNNMRIEEVPTDSSWLTKSHCFILEVDHDIFVLMPEGAKATQRRKIISVANSLRDDYHNGRATIEIIDEFSSDADWDQFFESLGSGSKDEIADDDSTTTYAREDLTAVFLYRVLLGDDLDLISLSKPYKQSSLSTSEVYILDTPCSGVYVWLGKEVDSDVKKNYNDIVQKYFEAKDYPDWVQVTRVVEGMESANFKQYFHNWDTVSSGGRSQVSEADAGYFSADAEESAAAAKLIGKSAPARGFMPDNGQGTLAVTRIAGEQEDLTKSFQSGVAVLYQTEAYVIKYQYTDANGEDAYVLYYWIGTEASSEDKAAAKELVSELEQELEGDVTVVKVPQGKESKHFLNIFKGALVILFGGKDNEYAPTNSRDSYEDDNIRLFRVEGTEPGVDMRAVQVKEGAGVLDDDDVFVLEAKDTVYVWNGKESNAEEKEAALKFVETVVKEKEVVSIDQGEEPEEFWDHLGGAPGASQSSKSGWRAAVSRRVTTETSLTAVTVTITGKIKYEELPPDFTQQDLSDDGVYILDTGEEMYYWQGKNTPERVKVARENIVKEYIEDDGLDRTADNAMVVVVKQGREPQVFRKLFPEWDNDMWDNQTSYEDIKNETKAANPEK